MPVPTFYEFARPTLEVLRDASAPLKTTALYEAVADHVGLGPEDRVERYDSGIVIYRDRIGWALSWMKKAGWVTNPMRAHWTVLDGGLARMADPAPITAQEMRQRFEPPTGDPPPKPPVNEEITPADQLEAALQVIRAAVEDELLTRLREGSPDIFEVAVLDVLRAMGYVQDFGKVEHTGKTGDGGIDGVLHLDRLGLEQVHVQAKKWEHPVGAPTVREFAGAMDGVGATKGVIVTTSSFTSGAKEYAAKVPKRIRLVDGPELVRLMVEFGVGVTHHRRIVPKVDGDYFDG